MSEIHPLTPRNCDLRDFAFMPLDVRRLLSSETWIIGTGDERAAAISLWLESWHQVPAASLPSDDRLLAHLAKTSKWKKVKDHALRGWVLCADGRLYHSVVAEKALEAWIEKLLNSYSGTAGNAKRWGIDIQTEGIREQIVEAINMLREIAPQSKSFKKKAVAVFANESPPDSPPDTKNISPPDSLGDRKRQRQGQGYIETSSHHSTITDGESISTEKLPKPVEAGTPEGRMAAALIKLGVAVTSMNPKLTELIKLGVTVDEAVECVAIARKNKPHPESIAFGYLEKVILSQRNQRPSASVVEKPSAGKPWYLDADAIARRAWDLGLLTRTLTDRKEIEDPAFHARVLKAAGISQSEVARAREEWEGRTSKQAMTV